MVGQRKWWYQREGTVGGWSVRPSYMEANVIVHLPHIKNWNKMKKKCVLSLQYTPTHTCSLHSHSIYNVTVRQSCQVMVITLFRSSHASADRHCRETLLSQVNQHETLLQKMTVALPQSWKTEMYLAMQTSSCGITRVRRVQRWLGAQANVIFQSHQLTKQQCCKKCSFVLKIIVNTFTKLGFRRQHWNAATRMIYTTLRRNTLHYKNSPNLQKDNTRKQRFTSNLGNNRRSICKIN